MGTTCAVHPGAEATFTCSRCGAFACQACVSPVELLCAKCEGLRGSVLGSDVSASGLIGDSFRLVARFGPAVATFAVLEAVLGVALSAAGASAPQSTGFTIVFGLLSIVVNTIVQGAWISLLASAAQGTPIGIGPALGRGAAVALPLFACNLILGIGVGFATLLLIVPGIILALGLSTAGPAVVISRTNPFEALSESWNVTSGHKGTLFVAFLGAGVVALVVVFAVIVASNMMASAMPRGWLVFSLARGVFTNFAMAPLLTLPVLAYLRLSRAQA